MVALGPHSFGGRFGKTGIALDRFVIFLDFPPFLIDCREFGTAQRRITRRKIENALAVILVYKDLLAQQKGEINPRQPDELHGIRFELYRGYRQIAARQLVFLRKGDLAVGLEALLG